MIPKKHIVIIGVLCVVALGLGYWYGMPEEKSPETKKPEPPEIELKPPTFTSDPSNPQNVIVEAAIRKSLKKPEGELTEADLDKVTSLDLSNRNLTDFTALAGLTQLKSLTLVGNIPGLTGISPLAKLTQLEKLHLGLTHVTDISALRGLTKLKSLDLGGTKITNDQLRHLSGLTQLANLSLVSIGHPGNDKLTDVSALAGLIQLKKLWLYDNHLTDISPLAGLKQLETLSLSNNKITDISALASLTNLLELRLNSNRLTDVSPLAKLTWLKTLAIHDNRIRAKADIEKLKIALPKCSIMHGFQ